MDFKFVDIMMCANDTPTEILHIIFGYLKKLARKGVIDISKIPKNENATNVKKIGQGTDTCSFLAADQIFLNENENLMVVNENSRKIYIISKQKHLISEI